MFRDFETRLAAGLEGGKWAAIALMAFSHLGMAIGGDWTWPAFWLGRVCAPIFCFLIVARLSEKPDQRTIRYLIKLSVWSVVAQVPFSAGTWQLGFHLNVLITLACGVGLIWIWLKGQPGIAAGMAVGFVVAAGLYDLGLTAPPIILAAFVAYKRSPGLAVATVSLGYAATLIYARPHEPIAPAICLLVPVVFFLCGIGAPRLPRLPGWAFYAFYPLHIGLIYLAFGPLPAFGH